MSSADSEYNKFLCFYLADENYAFRVVNVREVIFPMRLTPVPSAYDFMAGVINLRGCVIPIIDLRKRFKLREKPVTEDTAIIIVEKTNDSETRLMGVIVDAVRGVCFFPDLAIESPSGFGMNIEPGFVKGFSRDEDSLIVILDAEKIFAPDLFKHSWKG
jgi:purine-binding chemotaxis protein CheW